mgnify:CR=1 FL=1|jgi:hypothetical protein
MLMNLDEVMDFRFLNRFPTYNSIMIQDMEEKVNNLKINILYYILLFYFKYI